jgi:hypothetical protein
VRRQEDKKRRFYWFEVAARGRERRLDEGDQQAKDSLLIQSCSRSSPKRLKNTGKVG